MPFFPSGGAVVDDITLNTNNTGAIQVKPSTITQALPADITYSSNTTLTADVYAQNVTINSGVTVTTNGFNFYCNGSFINNGTITTGQGGAPGSGSGGQGGYGAYGIYIQANQITAGVINAAGYAGQNSTGGGGGGGGGGVILLAYGSGGYTAGTYSYGGGAAGTSGTSATAGGLGSSGSTIAAGGAGSYNGASGSAGSTPSAPSLTSTLINTWYSNGMSNYLIGAAGGTGPLNSTPSAASNYTNSYGGSGGGCGWDPTYPAFAGGAGQLLTINALPIQIPEFEYTSTSGLVHRLSTYNYKAQTTTSTTPVTAISQSITPYASGLIIIKAVVSIFNNTVGDGVQVYLFNGTNQLSTQSYTQEGLANNPQTIELYSEQYFTSFSNQTYSIQFNAITGGTASITMQEFKLEEVY